MRTKRKCFYFVVALGAVLTSCLRTNAASAGDVVPDEAMQKRFEQMEPLYWTDRTEFCRRVFAVTKSVTSGKQRNDLMLQAAYYSSRPEDNVDGGHRQLFRLFCHFAEYGRFDVVFCLAPLVDSTDEHLAAFAVEGLGGEDQPDATGSLDALWNYSTHSKVMSHKLIDLAYSQNPSAAIGVITAAMPLSDAELKQLALAAEAVDHALQMRVWGEAAEAERKQAIDRMKQVLHSDKWWVRRYVAEIVWRYDLFKGGELLGLLKHDKDHRVSYAATRPEPAWMVEERR